MADKTDLRKELSAIFAKSGLKGNDLKNALRDAVRDNWPDLPPWSTLDGPEIKEVATATVGSGVVLVFTDTDGVRKTVLAEAGDHYGKGPGNYMIAGGFINLSATPGSTNVPASAAPEDGRTGAAREVEEELKKPDGSALLTIDPVRLKPMDTKTLKFRNETRIVIGFALELNAAEVAAVKAHVKSIETDPAYKQATADQSNNHDSHKPEVSSVAIVPLADVAAGKVGLLHKDQQSLFQQVESHYKDIDAQVAKAVRAKTNYPGIH